MLLYPFAESLLVFSTVLLFTKVHAQDCGHVIEIPSGRINTEVKEGSWPWMVAIERRYKKPEIRGDQGIVCSGFLIDRKHVISAALCFNDERYKYFAHIGSVNHKLGEEFAIDYITIPEGYERKTFYDDIAILTLERDVTQINFEPLCLPDLKMAGRNLEGAETTFVAWGAEGYGTVVNDTLKLLSEMPVVSTKHCGELYREKNPEGFSKRLPQGMNEKFICAGFLEGQSIVCGGSSGAPLLLRERHRWFAIGVATFNLGCGRPGIPEGYTSIFPYLKWIRENTI